MLLRALTREESDTIHVKRENNYQLVLLDFNLSEVLLH